MAPIRKQKPAPARPDAWLTPGMPPMREQLVVPWPPDDPRFGLTLHVRLIDGRPELVGIDIRSFEEFDPDDPDTRRPFNPGRGFVPVTRADLMGLRLGEIADAAGEFIRATSATFADQAQRHGDPDAERAYRLRAESLADDGRPRRGAPPVPGDVLARVAALYREASAFPAGSDTRRRPAKYVEDQLRAEGRDDLTPERVRGWIHRARKNGLLPPTTERKPG